jgi:hypothetical protein
MPRGEHLKGRRMPGSGRKKGRPNNETVDIRNALKKIAEDRSVDLSGWLLEIAAEDKFRAFDLYLRLAEYCIPKLARIEVQADVTVKSHEEMLKELEFIDGDYDLDDLK